MRKLVILEVQLDRLMQEPVLARSATGHLKWDWTLPPRNIFKGISVSIYRVLKLEDVLDAAMQRKDSLLSLQKAITW